MAAVQLLEGVVVAQGRSGAILEIAGRRLGLEGAPPLSSKTRVRLDVAHGLRAVNQMARLVAIDGRMLETSLPVRLHPMAGSGARPVAEPVTAAPGAQQGGPQPAPEPVGPPGGASPTLEPAGAARLLQAILLARAGPVTSRKPRSGEALPDRAATPVASIAAETPEPPRQSQAGGWRLLLLPFGVEPADWLKLYLGEDALEGERQASEAEAASVRRAIFELELSHLGRCQLDALCHGQRFDLMVRSERAFDASLQSEIRAAHQEALDAAGWSGAIGFCSPDLLIMPVPERPLETPMTA